MIARYATGGLEAVMAERHATKMLYAWSQAGARDDVVERVAARSGEDAWLLTFVQLLYGTNSNLSLDALANFFMSPPTIVRRIFTLARSDPRNDEAEAVLRSIEASIRFHGGDLEKVFEAWEARKPGDTAPALDDE